MEKVTGTQALSRAIQLIQLFDDRRPFWTLPDLIEASGLKRTTVFRLLSALEAEGVIRKNDGGEYLLGPELIVWGGRAMRANNLRTVAQPILEALVIETTESVTLDTLWIDEGNRPMSIVIEEKLGRHVMGMSQYIGGRFPAHTTSTGKVLLAWQTETALKRLDLSILDHRTEFTQTDPDHFLADLAEIRTSGYALTRDELEIGLTAVAAPIFNHHAEIQAALCIAAPSSRIQPNLDRLVEAVTRSAAELSNALGLDRLGSESLQRSGLRQTQPPVHSKEDIL